MCLLFKILLSIVLVKAVVGDVSHVYGQPQQYLPPFQEVQQVDAPYPAADVEYSVPEQEGYPSGQPELDNALYDSNGYPDPVQQYANSYNPEGGIEADVDGFGGPGIGGPGIGGPGIGGPGFGGPGIGGPGFGGPGIGGPGGPGGFPGAFGPYGGFGPYGFGIQSGYEGYLVPTFGPGPIGPIGPPPPPPPGLFGPFNALASLLPQQRTILSLLGRAISFIFGMLGMTVVGGGITTAICTFTPLCTISFALPFVGLRATAKRLVEAIDLDKSAGERVARTAEFVQTAIEKFQKIQNDGKEEVKQIEGEVKEEKA